MLNRKIDKYIRDFYTRGKNALLKVLPIEVKSGKNYTVHSALNNVLNCPAYHLPEAIVLYNGNVHSKGCIVYAPIYMTMFLRQEDTTPAYYKIDLSGLA